VLDWENPVDAHRVGLLAPPAIAWLVGRSGDYRRERSPLPETSGTYSQHLTTCPHQTGQVAGHDEQG